LKDFKKAYNMADAVHVHSESENVLASEKNGKMLITEST